MRVPDGTDSETNQSIKHKTTMDSDSDPDLVPDYDTSSKSSTNWSIADGSLLNSVIFESSFASFAGSDQHESAVDSAPKSPLIMCPTSPDSGPCEIRISFAQSHEVRQVYVRSTARVFEIYYAPKTQSDNEYLCTVRCGVAYRDEEVLQAANFDESALARLKGVNRKMDGKRLKNDSGSSSNEDDWVEVKAPVLDSGSNVSSNSIFNLGSTQDLYEATAEINDAKPCTSITLRLLSLQNKGCLCVDEVYVFADPVDVADSENEVGQMGNTGGNSLMAMLPTLLQLSKTTGLRRIENEEAFGTKEKKQENGSKAIEPLNLRNEFQQEIKPSLTNQQNMDSQEASAATIEPNQHEIPPLKNGAAEVGSTCRNTDRLLNELVSRVSRVEDLLLKFEENMLKPISSIDARLQRVEQQLGELTKNPKNSELPSCTRFSAPEFSCHDSDNYSSCNIGNESSVHDINASNEKDISLPHQLDETIYSVNATRSCPSLVVTAPDYSTADDEEDGHASETDSPVDKPKQTVSIDDALASALANFLSSTSLGPEKYTEALAVKAPEFLPEEGSIDKKVSPESHFQVTCEPCCLDTRDEMDSTTASLPSECSLERIGYVTCSRNDGVSEQATKEVVADYQNQGPCHETVDCTDTPAEREHPIAGDMGNGEVSNTERKSLVLDEIDILNQFLENHTDDASDTDVELAPGNKEIKEVAKQGSQEDGSKAIEPLNLRNEFQQEIKPSLTNQQNMDSQEASAATIEPNQHEIPPLKNGAAEVGSTCRNNDRLLNELVSRVSRVEDLLLKFEENMLKPISSIDARLQRVEQQLGELTKNPKNSELPSCTRFSAPEFSCHDSDNYSSCNIGNESSVHDINASNEKDISLPHQLDETIYSVNATRSCPSLVVTAPDYSTADDEEDGHASETDSPVDKPKQTVSIDDALASALANFLSSTSLGPEKYTEALAVKAPEFLPEEGSIDKKVSPESHFQVTCEPCCLDTRDEMDSTTASLPSECSLERIGDVTCSRNDGVSEQATKEVVADYQNQGPCHETVDCTDTPAEREHPIAGDMGNGEVSNTERKSLVLDEIDILNQFLENHTDDASDTDVELAPGNKEIKEVAKQGSQEEFLQNFLELSYASTVVDFETPILDVKFTSQDNSNNNKSPLEALLFETQVTYTAASCSKKYDDGSQPGEDCKFISVEKGEPELPVTHNFLVDLDGVPLNSDVENLEDYHHASNNQEVSVGDGEPALHDSVDLDGCLSSIPFNLEVEKPHYPECVANHEVGLTSLI